MVLGILGLGAAVPTIIGLNEATKGTQDHEANRKEANRKARIHLVSLCELTAASRRYREQIHGAKVVLRNGYVSRSLFYLCLVGWIQYNIILMKFWFQVYIEKEIQNDSHRFTGSYHKHPLFPPDNMSGVVSTVSMDPPLLRWVFVDSTTFELRYGGKADSEGHIVGPWYETFCLDSVLDRLLIKLAGLGQKMRTTLRWKDGKDSWLFGCRRKMLGRFTSIKTMMAVDCLKLLVGWRSP